MSKDSSGKTYKKKKKQAKASWKSSWKFNIGSLSIEKNVMKIWKNKNAAQIKAVGCSWLALY